jgi:Hexameric tyrosine-coordinated heme protein (HTHP)
MDDLRLPTIHPPDEVRMPLRPAYDHDDVQMIALSFQTIAAANKRWR